ncbi:UDP-N-acetylmuramoyl-L-alanine--D-glutamate ligase [Rhodomicrobium vannielii ATCC 17100]|uniref:UDP-N-acetylmuramoyl-L-alanine--D-glutamate ligase n=1 Tax=Rhodomicrobium vannielii TaxID=1069 RepID=UPI001918BCDD|nr:UDP-N-acetylmuramoyl-L-alanine--D-glutamate ligase [Rhodomicrobium vannielii]MBJ7535727.1 UDP-N-acetylmuramoyl-L-alanine--D-glutamate ligase [Rhodomicrobium vannielii ATCC 17100]
MIEAHSFKGRKVAVFGMGMSGLAAARSLIAGGAEAIVWDDGEKGRDAAVAAGLPVRDLREIDWCALDSLVLAPGVPLTHPEPHWTVKLAQANGVEIIGDTEIFFRERRRVGARCPIIAITGTNGKSTTTALSNHLLNAAGRASVCGGNIGKAVLDLPPFVDGQHYVLELSSFQLDLTPSLDPDAGILLNITLDHIDRHGSLEGYAAVKEKLFANMTGGETAVIGADDALCDAIAARAEARGVRTLRISSTKPVATGIYGEGSGLFELADGAQQNCASLSGIGSLRGAHNAQNAAAALAATRSLGLPWAALVEGLKSFPGLAHRMQEIRRIGHVLFVNDSKATNADAAERALLSFTNIYWIAGGKPKAGGIEPLAPFFPRIRKAYLIGVAAEEFAQTIGGRVPVSMAGTLDRAVAEAAADAAAQGSGEDAVVLLSPACASYDQYPNFEIRGDAFRAAVEALSAPPAKEKAA